MDSAVIDPDNGVVTGTQEVMADVVTTASIVNDEVAFANALSADGAWIAAALKDMTFTEDLIVEGEFMNQSDERDVSDEITLVKGSLVLGGGIEYYLDNSTSILVGVTYFNGFSNILKGSNTADPGIKQKASPHYIELTLGVIF